MVVKVGFTLHGMNRCAGGKLTCEMHRSEAACNKMLLYSAFKGGLSNDAPATFLPSEIKRPFAPFVNGRGGENGDRYNVGRRVFTTSMSVCWGRSGLQRLLGTLGERGYTSPSAFVEARVFLRLRMMCFRWGFHSALLTPPFSAYRPSNTSRTRRRPSSRPTLFTMPHIDPSCSRRSARDPSSHYSNYHDHVPG
jgi:hypothetical protein